MNLTIVPSRCVVIQANCSDPDSVLSRMLEHANDGTSIRMFEPSPSGVTRFAVVSTGRINLARTLGLQVLAVDEVPADVASGDWAQVEAFLDDMASFAADDDGFDWFDTGTVDDDGGMFAEAS